MKQISIAFVIVLLATTAWAQADAASEQEQRAVIRHLPINEAPLGSVLLHFSVQFPDRAGAIVAHIAPDGRVPGFEVVAHRAIGDYAARIPAERVAPPGFSYFVVERMQDGSERPVFADAAAPHRVHVVRTEEQDAELERLQARGGQRSTLMLSGELVDFGDRRLAAGVPVTHDRYYQLEAGYAYSFLSTIEDVRLSLVRVRGEGGSYDASGTPRSKATLPGIDYGQAVVTVLATEHVRLRSSVLLGASQRGFEYGGGGSIVIGDPRATNLDAGVQALTTLGATVHLRLGFLATPRFPMGAAIEVSSFPIGDDAGVRLLYDVGYRFGPVTTLALRAGYQGRTSVSGGPSLAVNFEYGF